VPTLGADWGRLDPAGRGRPECMFFFFSNRLGCLPSLLLSLGVTLVLLFLLGVIG
jgi:hypothetical protein